MAFAVFVVVVMTGASLCILQGSGKKGLYCCIGIAADSGVYFDSGFCKCHLCSCSHTSANQGINLPVCKKTRQGSMSETF